MTIEINQISVDEEELRRQLEVQGYEIKKKPMPEYGVGDKYWDCFGVAKKHNGEYVGFLTGDGKPRMPDELVVAYGELYDACEGLVILSCELLPEFPVVDTCASLLKARTKIRSIKAKWGL